MKMLLVEDEKGVAKFVKKGLEEEHYTVDHVINGSEAVNYIGEGQYDLLILDIMLPGMNGIDVCRTIRLKGNTDAGHDAHCARVGRRQGQGL